MKDKIELDNKIWVFDIDKNRLGDIDIIQMSYLSFLLGLIEVNVQAKIDFLWLIRQILHINYDENLRNKDFAPHEILVKTNEDGSQHCIINGWEIAFEVIGKKTRVYFGDVKLNSSQFDEFRRVVLYQNLNGFDDTPMSDDVRKVVNQYYALKNKGVKPPTLEDKMLAIISGSNETRETIKSMPCRQFERLFHIIVDKTDYEVTMPLMPHLKNPNIDHWIYKKEKDKWSEIFTSDTNVMKPKVT